MRLERDSWRIIELIIRRFAGNEIWRYKVNERELDVLNILWKTDEPMTATDIVNAKAGLTQSTVTAVLRKLLKDELVEVAGITHCGKVLSRIYKPTEKSSECIKEHFLEEYNRFRNVVSPCDICYNIIKDDKSERLRLINLLDELE